MAVLLRTSARALGALPARSASTLAFTGGFIDDSQSSLSASLATSEVSNAATTSQPLRRLPRSSTTLSTSSGAVAGRRASTPHLLARLPEARFYATSSSEQVDDKERNASSAVANLNLDSAVLSSRAVSIRRNQREADRRVMESGLPSYTYTRPAGTIAGMRKSEDAIASERDALQLSLGEKKEGEHVAVARFIAPTLHMLHSKNEADDVLKRVRPGEVLSFDMEWTSSPITHIPNKTSIVQLASAKEIFILQIGRMKGVPSELARILADESIIKCGVSIHQDATKFRHDYDVAMLGCLELSALARVVDNDRWREREWALIALRDLCRIYLDRRLAKDKKIQVGRWDLKQLRDEQIHYAATDAYVGLEIMHALCSKADEGHMALTSHTGAFLLPNIVAALQSVIGERNTRLFTEAAERLANGVAGGSVDREAEAAVSAPPLQTSGVASTHSPQSRPKSSEPTHYGPFFGKSHTIETASEDGDEGTGVDAESELTSADKETLMSKSIQKRLRVATQNKEESKIARAATKQFSFRMMARSTPARRLFEAAEEHIGKRIDRPSWGDFKPEAIEDVSSKGGRE